MGDSMEIDSSGSSVSLSSPSDDSDYGALVWRAFLEEVVMEGEGEEEEIQSNPEDFFCRASQTPRWERLMQTQQDSPTSL